MLWFKEIRKLREEIQELRKAQEYWPKFPRGMGNTQSFFSPYPHTPSAQDPFCVLAPLRLSASDIINRFDELYEYLGIERKQIPSTPATSKLEKKSEASS